MTMRYRSGIGPFQDWHFHPQCPDWPEGNYIERSDVPPQGRICAHCVDLLNARGTDPMPRRA